MTKTIWRIPTWIRKIWPWSRASSTKPPTEPDVDAPETREVETEAGTGKETQANANEEAGRSHETFSLNDLEVGQTIVIRAAGKAAQKAEVVATAQPSKRGAFVKVRKYQAATDSWTRPSRCYAEQIIEPPVPAGE